MVQHQAVSVETLKAIANAFNAHDLDVIMEFFADECSLDMPRGPEPWGQRFVGKAAVREGLAARFKGLPDVHYSDDRHWVSGNYGRLRVASDRHDARGTPSPGAGMRPLGVSRREGR
jgi:ketosteroid isomerase-like protein